MNEQYLDPKTLSRIDNYALLARTIVEGFISGLHRSLYHGFGSEFVQYRNYSKGDDLKYIDWKVYARHNRYQIKVFQEETNSNCYIVLDTSASMAYDGDGGLSKLKYGKIMTACLSYLVNRQGDNVGFYAFSDKLHIAMSPSHRSGIMHEINVELNKLEPGGTADTSTVLNYLAEHFSRRGVIVFISDFLDPDPEFLKTIRRFRFSHHDVVLFHVLHDHELDFPFDKTVRFVDSETGDELLTAPEVVRHQYQTAMNAFLDDVETFARKGDIDYQRLRTSDPLAACLSAYLHRREAMKV
jgi:uncharacterized protein (DUF58 family)